MSPKAANHVSTTPIISRTSTNQTIEAKFVEGFEACRALERFAREHRPTGESSGTQILNWTLARSSRTFNVAVELCRLGYGQQASMLNRTLFEDMVYAHWAARFPSRSDRLMQWHEGWIKLDRIAVHEKHGVPHGMTPPDWDDLRQKRMRKLFRKRTWTGRSVFQMLTAVETMWRTEGDRKRLWRMHDVIHQAHNGQMHHSTRSLSFGVDVCEDGRVAFRLGPSEDLVPLELGFAFWTYANTVSLTVAGDDVLELDALATKYDSICPDRELQWMIAEAEQSVEPSA